MNAEPTEHNSTNHHHHHHHHIKINKKKTENKHQLKSLMDQQKMNSKHHPEKIYPSDNDVLCGRGNGVNLHPGNQRFRAMIKALKPEYVAASKPDKSSFPYLVVAEIQNVTPAGRFMKYCHKEDQWHQLPMKQAITKTRQALREGAPDIVESQKVERRSAVYIVDEIQKIVRDVGRSYVPIPSTRGIPLPKATNELKSINNRNDSVPSKFQSTSQNGEGTRGRYKKRPRSINDENYPVLVDISDHEPSSSRTIHYMETNQNRESNRSDPTHASDAHLPPPKGTCSNMQSFPSQYIAAAALLDLSHRPYTGEKSE